MKTETPNPTEITLKLGTTLNERLEEARRISRAMTTAIVLMYENDMAQKDNEHMQVFTTLLLEAELAENYLRKL